jgi:hypothetical protein
MKLSWTILSFVSIAGAAGAAVFSTNSFDKDTFVRALAPNSSYGSAGALTVSGTNATMNNPTNGAFDSFISFNAGAMVSNFNTALGTNNWVINGATLNITRNLAPGNSLFNSGNGAFQILWIANDTWTNGTGTPMAPGTNGVTYSEEPTYLNTNTDVNLGSFEFTGGTNMSFSLALAASFVTNMQAGREVGLFMTAIDPSVGFVFYSSRFAGNPSVLPNIVVSAAVQPSISDISVSGTDLVLSATNGVTGGTYYVLTSTNLTTPRSQWTTIQTNLLATNGDFTITVTNAANAGAPSPQFFILQTY